jgi:hypothetical protein
LVDCQNVEEWGLMIAGLIFAGCEGLIARDPRDDATPAIDNRQSGDIPSICQSANLPMERSQ